MRNVLALTLLFTGCPKGTQVPEAPMSAQHQLAVRVHTLDNGLKVFLSPNREEPRISARVVVRAGSAQDPRDATGMAHYLEHLLANKGTQQLGTVNYQSEKPHLDRVRELYDELFHTTDTDARAAIYASIHEAAAQANQHAVQNELKQLWGVLGGRGLNAFTNTDITAYVVDLPANRLEHWAKIEGDRFRTPVFRSFQTEVETVYEEFNRSLDNPTRALYAVLRENLYAGLPYDVPTIGTIEHLKNPSVSKTEAYFKAWYTPSNMAVILAGDFEPDRALALIDEHLGSLPNRPTPGRPTYTLKPLKGERRLDLVHRGPPQVAMAWRTVPFGHPDHAALVVADALLSNGATGLLDRALNNPQRVRGASARGSFEALAGGFAVYGIPRPEQSLEEVQQLLLEQVEALKAGTFDDADLEAMVRNARIRDKQALESNRARVSLLTAAVRYDVPWNYIRDFSDELATVTREDVLRVAAQYLGNDRVTVFKTTGPPEIPRIEAPNLPPVTLNTERNSPFFDEIASLPAPSLEVQNLVEGTHYTRRELDAGTLYVTPNPFSDLFELRWTWDLGYGAERAMCQAWSLWDRAGIGDDDLQAFEDWRYRNGVEIRTSCGRWSSSLVIRGESDILADALGQVTRRIASPSLGGEELAKMVTAQIARRGESVEDPSFLSRALVGYALEGENAGLLTSVLSNQELESLESAPLLDLVRKAWGSQSVISYTGPLDADAVASLVSPPGRTFSKVQPRIRRTWLRNTRPRVLVLDHDAVQSLVRWLTPHTPFDAANLADHRMISEVLGGSAGLVFQEIRESRGLAYSASGGYASGAEVGDEGYLWGSVGTQADKTPVVANLLASMLRAPSFDPTRFGRAQASAIEKVTTERIGFRAIGGAAEAWRRRGLTEDPRPALVEALRTRSVADVQAYVADLDNTPFTLVVTGDTDRINLDALAEIADVERVSVEDVVGY